MPCNCRSSVPLAFALHQIGARVRKIALRSKREPAPLVRAEVIRSDRKCRREQMINTEDFTVLASNIC
jgi:hypothetical protein